MSKFIWAMLKPGTEIEGYKRPDTSKGVFSVQYDHATKKEISQEDMSKFLVVSFLKA